MTDYLLFYVPAQKFFGPREILMSHWCMGTIQDLYFSYQSPKIHAIQLQSPAHSSGGGRKQPTITSNVTRQTVLM